MNSNAYGKPVPPKKDRRDAARESARLMREEQQKRDKRRRIFVRGGVGVGLLAVAAIVALVIVNSFTPAGPGPRNMASDGILLTGDGGAITPTLTTALAADAKPIETDQSALPGTANIVVYADYLCPFCAQFEQTNGAQITSLVESGDATLEYHPISILDNGSAGTKYSTRAANAVACVADAQPADVLAVNTALFQNQPEENGPGLTDEELVSLVADAGVTDEEVTACIEDGTFSSFIGAATKRALAGPLPNADIDQIKGTPTVLVNGVAYTGPLDDPATFTEFLTAQAAAPTE